MANRSVGVVGKFVMVGEMELFMMLGGPGKAPITKRCRAQCSEEDAVKRSSNPSRINGSYMPGATGDISPGGGNGGQEGGATEKKIPKSVRREETSCQFSKELEDETSAKRILDNHRFVAHGRQMQYHK